MSSSSISSGHWRARSDLKGYKLISSSYPPEWNYEGDDIYCYCSSKAPRWTAWTDENPGRRFYGCKNWKNGRYCHFYDWHDAKFPNRAREIILELKHREIHLLNQAKMLQNEVIELRNNAAELVTVEIVEENLRLKNELQILRKKAAPVCGKWLKLAIIGLVLLLLLFVFGGNNDTKVVCSKHYLNYCC